MASDKETKKTRPTQADRITGIVDSLGTAIDGLDELAGGKVGPEAQVLKGYRGSVAFIQRQLKSMVAAIEEEAA